MNTAPLQNPAGILPNAPPAARQSGASTAQTPFNQVLSNEVAQRRDAANADGKAVDAGPTEGGKAAAATGSGATADKSADETTAVPTALVIAGSAELLALVADLQRGSNTAADDGEDGAIAAGITDNRDPAPAIDPGLPRASSKQDAVPALADGKIELPAESPAPNGGRIQPAADGPIPNKGRIELPAHGSAPAGYAADPARDPAVKPDAAFAAAVKQVSEAKPAFDPNSAKNLEVATAAAQFAPSAVQASHDVSPQAASKLAPQVGTPAWDSALGQKVVWMAAGAQQSASLSLNPPELGPLQVVLHVNNARADATFISAQPEVRQALEAAMPRLREMMNEAGIQLGQANVSTGTPDQQPAWSEQAPHHDGRGSAASGHADTPLRSGHVPVTGMGRGLVDTFA
ncbi:MAG TPA: flagellar hook-length control protein FliK [Burkholderiaceae bacterium]|nr:flagellar hook-length control protein FliK [Burkholderiaceae bacterium]